jgi:sugar O-acyltransferase (sialic acid O-acetyltransferase NeuD family)
MKKVILYGSANLSKMVYYDSFDREDFEIACFSVESQYLKGRQQFMELPLIAFEGIEYLYPPNEYDMIALFHGMPRLSERREKYALAKNKGYQMSNYVSLKADISPEISMGDNNVILGYTHVGIGGILGSNNIIRQNVYLGHDFKVGNNVSIVPGCTIGGGCEIKDDCFIGLAATIVDHTIIANNSLIGAGSVVLRDTEPHSRNVGNPSRIIGYQAKEEV